jgi:arsenate reductase
MKIYHNPRCSKSRQTLALLESKTSNFEIIEYLKEPLKFDDIELLLVKLGIKPIDLVRKNEPIWKENYKNKNLSDDEIINAMVDNPKLMERPIVTTNTKAVIGRPPENVLSLFA